MRNIVCLPYHDWRKILTEGARTRDAHIIKNLSANKNFRVIVINRPFSFLELFFKRKFISINGELILKKNGGKLYKVNQQLYVIDYHFSDFFSLVFKGYRWFIEKYSNEKFYDFIQYSFNFLGFEDKPDLINFNVFASGMNVKTLFNKIIFDAWDNYDKFPNFKSYRNDIKKCYGSHAITADIWTTNCKENIEYFRNKYNLKNIELIPNGVDIELFKGANGTDYEFSLLKDIPRPIVGFGGKFTHLLNTDLINFIIDDNPNLSFVFVGKIIDKRIFNLIKKRPNFFYLGDIHYDNYPLIVNSFDVCIIPYVIKEQTTGANTIKLYEFLAAKKQIVGTRGNGVEAFEDYLFISDSFEEFSENIRKALNCPKANIREDILLEFSWDFLANRFNKLFSII